MNTAMQLTLGGEEVPADTIRPRRAHTPLTATQRDVLRHLLEHGDIRPVDAGRILYANQGTQWRERYASADGFEVLRRMAMRGLVHKEKPGRWILGPGGPVEQRGSERRRAA